MRLHARNSCDETTNHDIAIIEGYGVHLDQYLAVANLGHLGISLELE